MTNEEHTQKDFQIATQRMLLYNSSLLRTIIESQMVILKIISKGNPYTLEINELIVNNKKIMEEYFKISIPAYKDVVPPLKDF